MNYFLRNSSETQRLVKGLILFLALVSWIPIACGAFHGKIQVVNFSDLASFSPNHGFLVSDTEPSFPRDGARLEPSCCSVHYLTELRMIAPETFSKSVSLFFPAWVLWATDGSTDTVRLSEKYSPAPSRPDFSLIAQKVLLRI